MAKIGIFEKVPRAWFKFDDDTEVGLNSSAKSVWAK